MPNYFYLAKSFEGENETGVLQAKDEHSLSQSLKDRGLVLIRASIAEKTGKSKFNISFNLFGIPLSEKILMTKNLGVMFSTGLSLVKTFGILANQSKNQTLKSAFLDIQERINKGENLSDALAVYPKVFSEIFVNMVKVGEESGTLDDVFQILSLQLQKEYELKSKIRNAMIYPCIILFVMIIVGIIIVTFVLPNLNIFFTSLNVDIPIYTRILLNVGNFLTNHWYLLILVPLVLVVVGIMIVRTKKGKWFIDALLLKTPILSPIVKKSNSALLIRSLSSLIASGVSLVRSLEISSKTVNNNYFKDALMETSKKIKKGEKLSGALRSYQTLFPVGVVEMVEVGEETGKTSDILKKLSDFYEQQAVNSIEKLTLMIEPLLIIVLGVTVGFFAFSVIGPMYSSLQSIH